MPEEKYKDRISVYHYNEKTRIYTALGINPTESNDKVFFSIAKGEAGISKERVVLALNKQEIAFLIMELKKLYNELE